MIQVSDDGHAWDTARAVQGATVGGVVQHANLKARGRHVRIDMTRSRLHPTNNDSLYNVGVFGA